MKYCPITYEMIHSDQQYLERGLKLLSPKLTHLEPLNFTTAELRVEAAKLVGKMSVQGVQTKLSALLNAKAGSFDLVDQGGTYILKPQSESFPELPENEAITMTLASLVGIEVPVHGLVYAKDKTLVYFIKRFDRAARKAKLATEDFAQLGQSNRENKYESSMEQVAKIMQQYCTFPKIEAVKLFKRTIFNFLVGNEDMHLKNFSLITRGKIVSLSPAYDFLNTSIVLQGTKEEIALPLKGKKSKLKKKDFVNYYAIDRLGLNEKTIAHVYEDFGLALPVWNDLLKRSFLSESMREKFVKLVEERSRILDL